jgi:hypothetical protein
MIKIAIIALLACLMLSSSMIRGADISLAIVRDATEYHYSVEEIEGISITLGSTLLEPYELSSEEIQTYLSKFNALNIVEAPPLYNQGLVYGDGVITEFRFKDGTSKKFDYRKNDYVIVDDGYRYNPENHKTDYYNRAVASITDYAVPSDYIDYFYSLFYSGDGRTPPWIRAS